MSASLTLSLGHSFLRPEESTLGNIDLEKSQMTEIDNQLSLSLSTKHFDIRPDVLHFTFPNQTIPDAISTGVGISSKGLPLDLKLYGVQSFKSISHEGRLYQFTAGKTFKLSERANVRAYSNVTYNEHYFNPSDGFSHVAGGLDVICNLGKGYTLTGSVRGQKHIDSHGGIFKDNWVWGLNLNKSFK